MSNCVVNKKLLRKVLRYIKTHPKEWDQDIWGEKKPCGTAFCFAGHALAMAGAKLRWSKPDEDGWQELDAVRFPHRAYETNISRAAQRVLGLTGDQAGYLFGGSNTLKEIESIVSNILQES